MPVEVITFVPPIKLVPGEPLDSKIISARIDAQTGYDDRAWIDEGENTHDLTEGHPSLAFFVFAMGIDDPKRGLVAELGMSRKSMNKARKKQGSRKSVRVDTPTQPVHITNVQVDKEKGLKKLYRVYKYRTEEEKLERKKKEKKSKKKRKK